MVEEVTLDPHGENALSPGHVLVRNEVAFLESLAGSMPLFVQGEILCNWAQEVGRARGWRVNWLESPSLDVVRLCPNLTQEQARQLLARLSSANTLKRPLSLEDLATSLWPEISREGKDEVRHAWEWVLWRANGELGDYEIILSSAYGQYCRSNAAIPGIRQAYDTETPDAAWAVIRRWLRCDGAEPDLPPCPDQYVPAWAASRLQAEWRIRAMQTQGNFFEDLLDAEAPRFILTQAATVCSGYYKNNPEALTQVAAYQLRPFLPFQTYQCLESLFPAGDPGPLPTTLKDVCAWYSERYIPYRLRNRNRMGYGDRVRSLALDFGVWCLRYYANAITGGPGGSLLSWSRTAEICSMTDAVYLLLVLDGLSFTDAQEVTRFILDETSRLSMDRLEIVLSPLPTITRFAKPALISGVGPAQAFQDEDVGVVKTRDRDVLSALNASQPGSLIVWSLLEPDKTYHSRLDDDALRSEVSGRLHSIARRLARIVGEVKHTLKLRVVLTTDHGRLLSFSNRTAPVPEGMTAQGRAAWGPARVPFDRDGIFIDGEVAFLNAERFALPEGQNAAIMLSDATFLTSDGRGGLESYPHGGVFPEEVLIPWVQFTRDRGPLQLTFTLTGSGAAGANGRIHLKVANTSDVQAKVIQVAIPALSLRLPTELTVDPFRESEIEFAVKNWPAKKELATIEAAITYALPAGDRQIARVSATFSAEEMYTRDTTLEDLL